jgi:hypothetical protein
MSITLECGHHCGIRASAESTMTREAHCGCPECHEGAAPPGVVQVLDGSAPLAVHGLPPGQPMCTRWYARAGDCRPWLPQPPAEPARPPGYGQSPDEIADIINATGA